MESALDYEALANQALDAWRRDAPDLIAVDTETEGFEFFDPPFCVTIAWEGEGHYFELSEWLVEDIARDILRGTPRWVFHNAKFDLQKLILGDVIHRDDVAPDRFEDTQILSYLLDEHRRQGLKPLAAEILGESTDEEEHLKGVRRKLKLRKDDGYHLLPRDVVMPYAIKDAEFTARLFPIFWQALQEKNDPDLLSLYDMEKELVLVLMDMESHGLAVDLDYTERTAKEYGRTAVETEMTIRDLTGNEEFNPNSNPQIRDAFESRGIHREKFDKHVLRELEDPLADAILSLRSTKKLHGTYLLPILHEQREGVLHPNFRTNRTRTGRLASGGVQED